MHHYQLQGVEYVEARVTLFPNQYKKVYFSPCIYAKATDNPLKVEKKMFFFHMTIGIHWKILPQISFASLQANVIGV